MAVRKFFRGFLQILNLEDLRAQIYSLCAYNEGGFNYRDVMEMSTEDRKAYLLLTQNRHERERKAHEKALSDAKSRGGRSKIVRPKRSRRGR